MMRTLLPNLHWPSANSRLLVLLLLLFGSGRAAAQTAPANDDCAQAVSVPVLANCVMPANGTVAAATQSVPPTANCGFNVFTANDVWYSFVATNATQYVTLAPRFAAVMDVRSGTCTNSSSVFCTTVFSGNTNSTLVPGLTVGQTYFIRVYASGTVPPVGISSTFALCVSPGPNTTAPANDDCAGAIDVPVQTSGVCSTQTLGDNTNATASAGVQAPGCANYTGADIWFKVTVPASGTATVQTVVPNTGNDVGDTGMSIYSGTCTNLTQLGCDDDGGGNLKSLLTVSGRTPGEVLYVRVWGFGARRGTFALCAVTLTTPANDDCAGAVALTVSPTCTPTAGTFTATTQSLPPTTGCGFTTSANDVWYSFVATGTTQTLTYTGSIGAVLDVRSGTCANSTSVFCTTTFNNQAQAVGGLTVGQTYFLRIYANSNFPPTNSQFTICVTPGPVPPANDECAQAVSIPVTPTCGNPTSGNIANATQSLAPSTGCGFANTANDVWYSFVATGTTQTVTFSGQFGAVLDVRSGTCANSTSVFCTTTFNNQAQAVGGLTVGQTYFLRLYANSNFPPINGTFTLCVSPGPVPPANDECAGAIAIPVSPTCSNPASGNIANATQSLPPTANCGFANTANDVWYSFVATGTTQTLTFTGLFGAVVEVFSGTCANSTSLLCTTTFNNQAQAVGGLTVGQTYFLRLYANSNFTPTNPAFTLCVSPGPVPPANDECAGAIAIPVATACTAPVSGSYYNATQSQAPSTGCGFASVARDVWYSFVANGATQTITVNAPFGTVVDVRSGTCANSAPVSCTTTFSNQGAVVGGLTSGQTYFLRLYPNTNSTPTPTTGAFTVCVSDGPPPAINDDCAQAIPISVVQTCTNSTNGTIENSSQSLPPTASCGNTTVANDVWYSFVATAPIQLVTLTARFAAVLDVRSGTCANSTSLFCSAINPNSTVGTPVSGLTTGQTYFVRIYANNNFTPTPFSSTFTICITPAPTPPANDECAQAVPVPITTNCTSTIAGTVAAATQSAPPAMCGFANTANDVWYSFVANGPTQVVTLTPRVQSVFEVFSGTCTNRTSIICNTVISNNTNGTIVSGLTSGQTYYLRVYANGNFTPTPPTGVAASFTLCINPGPTPPANDECAQAVALTVSTTCTPTSGTVTAASQSLPSTTGCGFGTNPQALDVWYSFVATGGTQSIAVAGAANSQLTMDVRSGTCANSTSIYCATNFGTVANPQLVSGLTVGQTYYLRIYSATFSPPVGAQGAFTVCVTPGPTPPVNDECAGAIDVPVQFGTTCVTQTAGSNIGSSGSTGMPAPTCANYRGEDIWFKVTVPASGTVTVQTVTPTTGNDVGDTGMSIYSGTCGSLTQIGCDDDGGVGTKSLLALTGRTPGEVLYIRVWRFGGNLTGSFALCATAPSNCQPPFSLNSSNVTANTATIGWQAGAPVLPGITFEVEYGPQGFTPGTGTVLSGLTTPTAALNNLLAGTRYCFYVRQACGGVAGGNSAYAGPECFTTPNIAPCASPTALATSNVTTTAATVSWQAGAPGAGVTYTLEYGPLGFTPGTGTLVTGLTGLTTQLTNLMAGRDYCVYVRQTCPGGTGSSNYAGPQCFTTLTGSTCTAPSGLAANNLTANTADLSWVAGGTPTASTTYTVEYGPQGFTQGTGTLRANLTVPSLALTGLQPNTNYCYYVRQSCAGGGNSAYTGPRCFTTAPGTAPCAAPTALAAGSITATGATLSWVAGSSPVGTITYTVEYGPQGFTPGTGTVVSNLQALSTPLSNLTPGTAYCFYVRQTCPGGGTSPVAGPQCFTTSAITLANDEPCGAVTLPVVAMTSPPQPVLSTNAGATVSAQPGTSVPTTCATNPTPRDVWFTMTPTAGTPLTLSFSGAAAGLVRVFTAPSCSTGPFTLVACQGSGTPNTGLSTMTLTGITPGQTYYVAVSGFGPNDTPGSFSIEASSVVLATRPQAETNALVVYPNPSNTGQLTLRLQGTSGPGEAVLLNAIGQSVLSFRIPAGTAEQVLVTKGLATGVYTLRIVVGTQVLTRKVVLE